MRASRFFSGLMILLLMLGAIFAVLWFSDIMSLRTIEVQGQSVYSKAEIIDTSGLQIGMNLFQQLKPDKSVLRLGLSTAEIKLSALPYIRYATVRLLLPNTVDILVKERIPAGYIAWVGNYLLVDEEGIVLAVDVQKPTALFKEIRGVPFDQYAVGEPLVVDEPGLLDTALTVLRAIRESDVNTEYKLWDHVDWVDVVDLDRIAVSLEGRVTIRLNPTTDLQYHIDFAKEIFSGHIGPEEHGMIDFTKGGYPSFIPD